MAVLTLFTVYHQHHISVMSDGLTLIEINRGGIASLSDRSRWRIAPGDLEKIRFWATGHAIEVKGAPPGRLFGTRLANLDTGQDVGALPFRGPS